MSSAKSILALAALALLSTAANAQVCFDAGDASCPTTYNQVQAVNMRAKPVSATTVGTCSAANAGALVLTTGTPRHLCYCDGISTWRDPTPAILGLPQACPL